MSRGPATLLRLLTVDGLELLEAMSKEVNCSIPAPCRTRPQELARLT
jgi:hypothetical protein